MKRISLILLLFAFASSCGRGDDESGSLTADERQRLENIADRLDEENAEVRELLGANVADPQSPPAGPDEE